MKRETISLALNYLADRHVTAAAEYSPGPVQSPPERTFLMKKKRFLTLALAAALVLSLGVAAYAAAGFPRWTVTAEMADTGEYTGLESLPEVEKITGYDICLPERFSSGFAFSKLSVDGEAAVDDDGTVLREYYTVNAAYTSADGTRMTLTLTPVSDLPDQTAPREASSLRRIGGTEVRLYRDHYRFVPEDYEKTAADLAAEEGGHYYISFGAEQAQEKDILSADVVLGDVEYTFFFDDASLCTDDTLFRMAEELIEARGE